MKRNKRIKHIIGLLLIVATMLQVVGCSANQTEQSEVTIEPMEVEQADNFSYDFIGGTDVMPIVGFYGPTPVNYSYNGNDRPDYFTDEIFQLIAETGINVMSHNATEYTKYPQHYKKMFELGEKYGVGIMVHDARLFGTTGSEKTLEEADAILNEYANNEAYCGNYVIDEPGDPVYVMANLSGITIDQSKGIFEKMNTLGIPAFGNLIGFGDGKEEKFTAYVKKWIEVCKPSYISVSNYPYYGDGHGNDVNFEVWFEGLSLTRKCAEEANLPFWGMLQAGNEFNDSAIPFDTTIYNPTLGQSLWNANIYLAIGAKGIQWFPLMQPVYFAYAESEPFDFQRNGLIGAWGNKTQWFYHAKEISKQIEAVDEVLMNSVNKGILVSDETVRQTELSRFDYILEGTSWRELKDVSGNAVVGCFNYQGKTVLYVMNYEREYAQNITLDFVDEYDIQVIQGGNTENKTTDSLELVFAAGEGALIVFE